MFGQTVAFDELIWITQTEQGLLRCLEQCDSTRILNGCHVCSLQYYFAHLRFRKVLLL
jgi:hypothetical protein